VSLDGRLEKIELAELLSFLCVYRPWLGW